MPANDECKSQGFRLAKWLVQEGEEIHPRTALAILEGPAGKFAVLANGNGFLRERLLAVGMELHAGAPIATVAADGDQIPYGKPYSLAERVEDDG